MADLIERAALLAEMRRSGRAAYMLVQEAPTVDAVKVVRCKDCKNMVKLTTIRYCTVWHGVNGMGDVGFCNYGERREDDG